MAFTVGYSHTPVCVVIGMVFKSWNNGGHNLKTFNNKKCED